ncbi:hypothetical protein Smic_84870 [Streptomyces microflavus]|uniref:Uncharacterized protein n=1 Tax=Streptomyces microflavus TaxID=1919 RepID=A0A7J0D5B2_STRMI|nr:hypothetical protein Smic_84870 [Streptomyces microflavus]
MGEGDPRFENGPLAVVDADADGQVLAYCIGGLVLDVPAKSLASLVEWTLKEARLGQSKLSGPGRAADPLLVLTQAALERYGLPAELSAEEKDAGRIPEGHKVIKQLARAEWKLTKRGSGRGRGSTAPRPVRSGPASSCASPPGTRWTPVSGARPGSSRRPNSPASWVSTPPG